jgi:DNA-binding response OmpR family regulator
MTPNIKLLVIDDDVELCELITEYLSPNGFDVSTVHNGKEGLDLALSENYALVILDVMLPGIDGLEVLRNIRLQSRMPVLMLTALGSDVDRIVGLEIGADDYLAKPFNPRELIARIRAILRRTQAKNVTPSEDSHLLLSVGDVELNRGTHMVSCAGHMIELTSVEFLLLDTLMSKAGAVVNREDLSKVVLGRDFSPFDRSIDIHISKLRKKLGSRPDGIERIKSIRGVGYIYTR